MQWLVAGVATLVVLASFALIAYEGFGRHRQPALLRVQIDSIAGSPGAHRVHVRVVNEGGSTAADVEVSATAAAAGTSPAVLRFDYLPAGSEVQGVFLFDADPRAAGVQVDVKSYRQP